MIALLDPQSVMRALDEPETLAPNAPLYRPSAICIRSPVRALLRADLRAEAEATETNRVYVPLPHPAGRSAAGAEVEYSPSNKTAKTSRTTFTFPNCTP